MSCMRCMSVRTTVYRGVDSLLAQTSPTDRRGCMSCMSCMSVCITVYRRVALCSPRYFPLAAGGV